MFEIPSILKPRLRLPGVNATLKRVAEKDELAMHGLSDLDSMMRSPETSGVARAPSHSSDLAREKCILGCGSGGGGGGGVESEVLAEEGASGGVVLLTSTAGRGRPNQRRSVLVQRASVTVLQRVNGGGKVREW